MKVILLWLLFVDLLMTRYNDYKCDECFGTHIMTCPQNEVGYAHKSLESKEENREMDCKCLYDYKWCLIRNKFLNGTGCFLGMYKQEYMEVCIVTNCDHCYILSPKPLKEFM